MRFDKGLALRIGSLPLSRENNFDGLRLLAALAVLVSHSFALVGLTQPTLGGSDLGSLAVYAFFGISGFLIAQSWVTDPRLLPFIAKRGLRILPGLAVMLALVVLVLGPMVTTLPSGRYFSDPATWSYLFNNLGFVMTHELPGVFVQNPGRDVNGSIHTLGPEVIAYLAVAVLGVVGGLRLRWTVPALLLMLVVLPHQGIVPWPDEVFLFQAFAVGALLYFRRDRLPWHWTVAVVAVAGWLLAPARFQDDLAVFVIPYATIFAAYRGPAVLRRLATRGDFSYGVYIYAWPIGQTVVLLWGPSASPLGVIAVSLPLTYAAGALSWVLVERPALALKRQLLPTREPRTPARSVPDAGRVASGPRPST